MKPPSKKPLIEVQPDHYKSLKIEAARHGRPMKQLTAVLLDYALGKLALGLIHYVDPAIADGPLPPAPRRAAKKKEAASV